VARLVGLMESHEQMAGADNLFIVALIESANGILHATEIAASSRRVLGIALGAEDLCVDLGVPHTAGGLELFQARCQLVLAAAAAGCCAIDAPCVDLKHPDQVVREARFARRLGFASKATVHPSHVAAVNASFTPTQEEADRAKEIVTAFEAARASGLGVIRVAGKMIDEPTAAAYRRVVSRARQYQVTT
jgi:citrate lyase subunit beta / citryl-CoA lyase